jgi:hypothetical protein
MVLLVETMGEKIVTIVCKSCQNQMKFLYKSGKSPKKDCVYCGSTIDVLKYRVM